MQWNFVSGKNSYTTGGIAREGNRYCFLQFAGTTQRDNSGYNHDVEWNEKAGEWARSRESTKQVNYAWSQEGKEARFCPVILLVIYFGIDKKWDGARCLYDMLDMNKDVEPYISNYKMNLFDFHDYDDFSVFKTENRLLFETLASCQNKKEMYAFMKAHEDEYEKWDILTTKLMCDLLGLKYDKILKKMTEEGINVCRAMEELMGRV